jgi:antitoxin component of MazEF toxin-antitoxin module
MRLQRHINRKVEGKEYGKYVIVIPPEEVEQLGWAIGQELKPEVKGRKLVISAKENNH